MDPVVASTFFPSLLVFVQLLKKFLNGHVGTPCNVLSKLGSEIVIGVTKSSLNSLNASVLSQFENAFGVLTSYEATFRVIESIFRTIHSRQCPVLV